MPPWPPLTRRLGRPADAALAARSHAGNQWGSRDRPRTAAPAAGGATMTRLGRTPLRSLVVGVGLAAALLVTGLGSLLPPGRAAADGSLAGARQADVVLLPDLTVGGVTI